MRFLRIGSSCVPSSVPARPVEGLLFSAAEAAGGFPASPPDDAPGAGSSKLAKMASQSCGSEAAAGLPPAPAAAVAEPFWFTTVGLPPGRAPVALPPPTEEPRLAKSKLLSTPNGAVVPVRFDSDLVACEAGGDESKTGLKSSSPERLMVAKSSSAEPSLASSRPSKSSSVSSKAPFAGGGGGWAAAWGPDWDGAGGVEPKMSSTLAGDVEGGEAGFSLDQRVSCPFARPSYASTEAGSQTRGRRSWK